MAAALVLGPAGTASSTSGTFPVRAADVAVDHRRGQPVDVHAGFAQIPGSRDLWPTVGDLVRPNQASRGGHLLRPHVAGQLWTPHAQVGPAPAPHGPVVVDAYGYGTFLVRVAGPAARTNPGDDPGYPSLLTHLPAVDVDLAVPRHEDAPSVDAALAQLTALPEAPRD